MSEEIIVWFDKTCYLNPTFLEDSSTCFKELFHVADNPDSLFWITQRTVDTKARFPDFQI